MNLKWVHAFLILLSAALAVVFGLWCVARYGHDGGFGSLLSGIVAFVVSLGLILYDSWFVRNTRVQR